MLPASFVVPSGGRVVLGGEIAKGGEGAIREVVGSPGLLAKLYHAPLGPEREGKLSLMVAGSSPQLEKYTAWPEVTLHAHHGGPIVGFLMRRLEGSLHAIHVLYGPKNRMQVLPDVGWDRLVLVARNTAAAFDEVHRHGHVVGDVNESNVLVAADCRVFLVDCDSFQVAAEGAVYPCNVGVPSFTPPELLQSATFRGQIRAPNHDNFGLAVLLFLTLMGGRHPFAGVPLREGVGESLSTDIREFRYAYTSALPKRGIAPPEASVPISVLPATVAAMFEVAFGQVGPTGVRPVASAWVAALDALRKTLRACSASGRHRFPGHLAACPWCALEARGVIYFLPPSQTRLGPRTLPSVEALWVQITAIGPPPPIIVPTAAASKSVFMARPLRKGLRREKAIAAVLGWGVVIGGAALWFTGVLPLGLVLIGGIACLALLTTVGRQEIARERSQRMGAEKEARARFEACKKEAEELAAYKAISSEKRRLSELRAEYLRLGAREARELEVLRNSAMAQQRKRFLERFYIAGADIPGVGDSRKTALRSFGIETAADVVASRVRKVPGFGPALTSALVDWRSSHERRFAFNGTLAVSDADRTAVKASIERRARAIEVELAGGVEKLRVLQVGGVARANELNARLVRAFEELQRAATDLSVFGV